MKHILTITFIKKLFILFLLKIYDYADNWKNLENENQNFCSKKKINSIEIEYPSRMAIRKVSEDFGK